MILKNSQNNFNAESVNELGLENYFDENISLIGTGKHELFTNLHEFLESFKFDVKRRGKIRIEVQNLYQEEGCIVETANAFAEDAQKVLSVGMNAHVAKPVDMNILVPTMMRYL